MATAAPRLSSEISDCERQISAHLTSATHRRTNERRG